MPALAPLLLLVAVVSSGLVSGPVRAEAWRSVLYPENGYDPGSANLETDKVLQDFSYAGYRRGEAPVPEVAGPVFDVTAAPFGADAAGAADATAAIQAALDAAGEAGGGVVYLPPGVFRVSVPAEAQQALLITRPGVVLRGAGADRSFLVNTTHEDMRRKAVVRVRGPAEAGLWGAGVATSPLSRDLLVSTREIPVEDAGRFAPGDTVVVRNDITDAWALEHGEPGWVGHGRRLRGIAYRRTVVEVDQAAGVVQVDAPTRYALKRRDGARLVKLAAAPLTEVGLEDFAIGNVQHPGARWGEEDHATEGTPAHDMAGSYFLVLSGVRDAWVRRIATHRPEGNTSTAHLLSGGLSVRESTHVTVADCRFGRPQYGGGGGNGYLFTLANSGECLVTRSEARFARHGFVITGFGSAGNVLHACLDAETGLATGATGRYVTSGKGSDHHMHMSQANLIDSCVAEDSWFEARYRPHGSVPKHNITAAHTVFWNIRGTGASTAPVVRSEQARHGYVIGTSGPRSRVELPRRAPRATDPADHVEGAGRGDTLEPRSLFLDQRARRLGPAAQAQ